MMDRGKSDGGKFDGGQTNGGGKIDGGGKIFGYPPSIFSPQQNFLHQLRRTTKNPPSFWPPSEFLPSNEEKDIIKRIIKDT